ncbi:MAG: hypothetical protein A2Y14_00900 [Verrucomicrobia bacterium GWF2_51_19]|nr:MAG: hypothetical protein A2Y14_00900 [Verrucomicrobia bacterium GWF2_51_19]
MPDGTRLRYATFKPKGKADHSVVLLQGVHSTIEFCMELTDDLLARNYEVWVFDWRGQGGSDRYFKGSQRIHIDSFDSYLRDLEYFLAKVVRPEVQENLFFLAFSMGGHLCMRYLMDCDTSFLNGAFFVSPMFDIHTRPYPRCLTPLIPLACKLGLKERYFFRHRDFSLQHYKFEGNKSCHCRERFQYQRNVLLHNPQLATGGFTFGWIRALLQSLSHIHRTENLQKIQVPVFIVDAGEEYVVNASRDAIIASHIPNATLRTYAGAFHNILIEVDTIRSQFLEDFDFFIKKATSTAAHTPHAEKPIVL